MQELVTNYIEGPKLTRLLQEGRVTIRDSNENLDITCQHGSTTYDMS